MYWMQWSRSAGFASGDRKSTRLNSSHLVISYAVFCLKKKTSSASRLALFLTLFTRISASFFFFFNDTATTEIYTLSLHDALPICDFLSQGIYSGVRGHFVLVVRGRQAAEDQRHRDHVLDAVVAVGRVRERPFLVDDPDGSLMCPDPDLFDVCHGFPEFFHFLKNLHGAFHRGLRMEFRRVGDLEQHVLHHVAAERALELERLALEEHVVEAPGLVAERRRVNQFPGP